MSENLSKSDACRLRPIKENDLELVLEWRNSFRVRNYMINNHIITIDEHKAWYNRLLHDDSSHCLIFEMHGEPVGVVNFNDIDRERGICFWGFYLGRENLPKGTGTRMGTLGIKYAFHELGMQKICAKVLEFNQASIRLHQKLGFVLEGVLRDHVRRENKLVNLLLYGLNKNENRCDLRCVH